MFKAGLVINPVAGCGQFLNLKGSDTLTVSKCPRLISLEKGIEFLNEIRDLGIHFYTASGKMGEEAFLKADTRDYEVIHTYSDDCDSSDTRAFVQKLQTTDAEALIFFGGDGTARDIVDAGCTIPVVGVPLGTKMFSSVFTISLSRALQLLRDIVSGKPVSYSSAEVIDLDESSYSEGRISIASYGKLKVPDSEYVLSMSKAEYPETSAGGIAEYIIERMEPTVNYITGPGTTCKTINEALGLGGSLLGFDLIRDGKLIETDLSESQIFSATKNKTIVILSPIGGQGFLIGRGNKQFSGRILERIGFQNIMVIATEEKVRAIRGLFADINDYSGKKPGFIRVLFSYGRFKLFPLIF